MRNTYLLFSLFICSCASVTIDGWGDSASDTGGDGDGDGAPSHPPADMPDLGEPCTPDDGCLDLECIGVYCGGCVPGRLGCACLPDNTCAQGFACLESSNGTSNVCARYSGLSQDCADHGIGYLEHLPAADVDGLCIARCAQGDNCGPYLECSPVDHSAMGFCAYPL